nr:beta-galactosidase 3-like [Tanacetum cinerariifolium]
MIGHSRSKNSRRSRLDVLKRLRRSSRKKLHVKRGYLKELCIIDMVIGWCVLYTPSHGADPSTYFIIRGLPSTVENEYGSVRKAYGGIGHSYMTWAANMAIGLDTGVENEYGSVRKAYEGIGHSYMTWAANMAIGLDTGIPWVMCKQDDTPDPVTTNVSTSVDIENMGKNLKNASPLEIMDRALEKYENDIDTAISIAFDQKSAGQIVSGRRLLGHCLKRLPPGVWFSFSCLQSFLRTDEKGECGSELKYHNDNGNHHQQQ